METVGNFLDYRCEWQMLASKLEMSKHIQVIETLMYRQRYIKPTVELLTEWCRQKRNEATIDKLIGALQAMERQDIVDNLPS